MRIVDVVASGYDIYDRYDAGDPEARPEGAGSDAESEAGGDLG